MLFIQNTYTSYLIEQWDMSDERSDDLRPLNGYERICSMLHNRAC